MYGNPATAPHVAGLESIYVNAIEDRLGQQLRNDLIQRLSPKGETGRNDYALTVKLIRSVEGLGHRKDARATLGRMTILASFTLLDDQGTGVLSGSSRSIVSFNYLGPRYASIVVERDAEERAASELAEDIRRQLAVYFTKEAVDRKRSQ